MSQNSYEPLTSFDGHKYFPAPFSLYELPSDLRDGLIPVGILALLSVGATLALICFIVYRLATWKLHYNTFLGHNQYVLLVLNLLLADLQQGSAFLLTWHWIRFGRILAPSSPCFAQGWLLHSGDVSSGFFVLAIAIHTYYTAVQGKRVSSRLFVSAIIALWAFAYFLTAIGIALHGNKYFVRAGAWCWVSEAYEVDRLAFHYIWVFIVQFGTILIYIVTFYKLRRKTTRLFKQSNSSGNRGPNLATVEAVNRITMLMTLYPCVYVVLTLPLSAGRMWMMAHEGRSYSNTFACVAGALLTSCGWVDALLYTLTRRRLLRETMPADSTARRTAGSDWDTELGSKGITHTRSVTVEGGRVRDRGDVVDTSSAPGFIHRHPTSYERSLSPTGSIDPILQDKPVGTNVKSDVSSGVFELSAESSEKRDQPGPLPSSWTRLHYP